MFVDEIQEVFGAGDQLLLLSVEVDELLEVRLVVHDERVHVLALCLEELPEKLRKLALNLGGYRLFDRRHRFVYEHVDVGERLALLAELDLLKLHVANLLLAHPNKPTVHSDVRRLGTMASEQRPHRIGETDRLHASRKPCELGL